MRIFTTVLSAVLFTVLSTGCGGSPTSPSGGGSPSGGTKSLQISPSSVTLAVGASQVFTASGAAGSYSWDLEPWSALDVFQMSPTQIRVTILKRSSDGTASVSIHVPFYNDATAKITIR